MRSFNVYFLELNYFVGTNLKDYVYIQIIFKVMSEFYNVLMIKFFVNFYLTHKLNLLNTITFSFDFGLLSDDF